jgi:hypothetical protein
MLLLFFWLLTPGSWLPALRMMYRMKFWWGVAGLRGLAGSLLCLLVLCAASGDALGQSGRRGGRQGEATPSSSPAGQKDEATAANVNAVEAPKLSLFVADHFSSEDIPSNIAREIVQSFYSRLHERYASLAVTQERDMSRKEAVERARKVQKIFVVWLQVETDRPETEREKPDASDYDTLAVTYVVFTPGTAEIKTEGRVYYQRLNERAMRNGANRQRRRPPVRLPSEETLEGVGRLAADRVLATFKDLLPQP